MTNCQFVLVEYVRSYVSPGLLEDPVPVFTWVFATASLMYTLF
jgi:hypothetical protein